MQHDTFIITYYKEGEELNAKITSIDEHFAKKIFFTLMGGIKKMDEKGISFYSIKKE